MVGLLRVTLSLPTEAELFQKLSKYLMSDEQLEQNGYPRCSPDTPGIAVIMGTRYQETDTLLKSLCWFSLCFFLFLLLL